MSTQVFALESIVVPPEIPLGEGLLWGAIVPGVIKFLLLAVFILSFIYLLLGGISWITSGGDREALEKAKKRTTYAIVGLVVSLLSFVILNTILNLFGVGVPKPPAPV